MNYEALQNMVSFLLGAFSGIVALLLAAYWVVGRNRKDYDNIDDDDNF